MEEAAIELAHQFDMLPRWLMDEDAKCMCGNLFDTKMEIACRPLGWRYWYENCRKSPSPLHGVTFNYSNRSVKETFKLILCFVARYSHQQIVNPCKVDEKTVTDWSKRCRFVMEVVNSNDFHKLNGHVEIDETCLCRKRYVKGCLLKSQLRHLWKVAFIDRKTKPRFMNRVFKRTIPYMDKLMTSVLAAGCTIYTDKLRTYDNFIKRNPGLSTPNGFGSGFFMAFFDDFSEFSTIFIQILLLEYISVPKITTF